MIRFCETQEEYEQAQRLCVSCFNDPPDYVKEVFKRAGRENLLVYLEKGRILSMAFMLPFTLDGRQGHYIYCACTDSEWRGRGLMSQLLEEAVRMGIQRGDEFSFLLPAQESLFAYYRARGYTIPFYCGYRLATAFGSEMTELREAGEEEFYKLRGAYLASVGGLCPGTSASSIAYFDALDCGGKILTDGTSLAVCYPEKTVFVKELLAAPEHQQSMINALLAYFSVPTCTVQGPSYEDEYVLGLLRWMKEPSSAEIYGNLLLD